MSGVAGNKAFCIVFKSRRRLQVFSNMFFLGVGDTPFMLYLFYVKVRRKN